MALRASDIDALLSPAPAQSRPRGLRASDIDALIGAPTLRANASGSAGVEAPKSAWIDETMGQYTRDRAGIDRLHEEAKAAGVPLGRAVKWKRNQLERQDREGALQPPTTAPLSLGDANESSVNERAAIIRAAEQVQSSPLATWPNTGSKTSIPGEGDDAELTSALDVLENYRKRVSPEVPGPQFMRQMFPRGTAQEAAKDPDGSWGAAGESMLQGVRQSVAGGAQAIGERLRYAGNSVPAIRDAINVPANALRVAGYEQGAESLARMSELGAGLAQRPTGSVYDDPDGWARYLGQQGVAGSGPTLVGMGAGLVNPVLGAATFMGSAAGSEYGRARIEDSAAPSEAGVRAITAAATEGIPEAIGGAAMLGRLPLMKLAQSTARGRAAIAMPVEAGTEALTEKANIELERARGKYISPEEESRRIQDAAVIGGVMGGTIGAGTAVAEGGASGLLNIRETIRQANSAADISSPMAAAFTRAAQETTARILGPTATPDAAAGAQIADDAFRSAGVGTVAAADIAEQDALARDLDAAQLDQLGSEAEIDRLLTGNAPRERTDLYRASIPGAIPQGVQVTSNQDAFAAPGTIGGRDAPAPIQVTTLADRSVFVPGDPVAIRQKLADAGSQWQGMAQERNGVPGVRFSANSWADVQGVVGGSVPATGSNREHGNGPGNTPMGELANTQSRDGYSAPRSPVASDLGLRTGPAGTAAPAAGVAGNASGTTTQAAAAVDGPLASRGIAGSGPDVLGNEPAGIGGTGGIVENVARNDDAALRGPAVFPTTGAATGAESGAAGGDQQGATPAPPALQDLTDDERNFWGALTAEVRESIDNPGGRMIRNADGSVGRTKWADLGPMSGFWRERPKGWNSDDVLTALDRAASGEKLTRKQSNIVDYAKGWVRDYAAQHKDELAVYEADSRQIERESVRDDIESTLASVADTSPQQRASVASLGHDYTAKLIELKRARAAGALNPDQQEAYIDLLEQDRETGKVAGRPMIGIGNKTAYVDALMQGKLMPVQVFLDADNFKALNDKFGHDVGDDAIRLIADVVRTEFGDGNVFHRGGDEFLTQGMTQEEVAAKMARVQSVLANYAVDLPLSDGRTATLEGIGVSYGTGANEKAADESLKQDKQRRKEAGLRFDRREGDGVGRVGSGTDGARTDASRTDANPQDQTDAAAEGVGDARSDLDGTIPVGTEGAPRVPSRNGMDNQRTATQGDADTGNGRGVGGETGAAGKQAPSNWLTSGRTTEAPARTSAVTSAIADITRAFGAKFTQRLLNQQWFKIVESVDQLPPDVRKSITGGGIAGFVLPDGRVFIVVDAIDKGKTAGVVLHEVGVHFGMSGILGADFPAVLRNFKRQRAKDAAVGRAYERATEAAERGEDGELTADALATLDEEALAYYVEANWNTPDARGIVAKVIDAIKSMLNRLGIPLSTLNASPEMLRKVAIGAARKAADGRVSVGEDGALRYHKAWHGSPHDFDKFRLDNSTIGTGEGAQAYGYGLYMAGSRDVADHYRKALSGRRSTSDLNGRIAAIKVGGKPLGEDIELDEKLAEIAEGQDQFGAWLYADEKSKHWSDLAGDESYPFRDYAKAHAKAWSDLVATLQGGSEISSSFNGRLYEVELAPNESDYLDWDAPLSEQSEKVRAGVRQAIRVGTATVTRGDGERPFSVSIDGNTLHRYKLEADALEYANELNEVSASEARIQRDSESATTGEQAYRAISESKGGDREASRALHAAGIPGIRYLDGSSRGGKTGWRVKFKNGQYSGKVFDTKAEADAAVERGEYNMVDRVEKIDDLSHNFVIFDDSQVEVKAKYSRRVQDGRIRKTVAELTNAADSMGSWRDWYDRHDQTLRDVFGDDAELFQKLLSATSQAASVPANVGLALKAYRQLFSGEPFTGYLPAVIKNLDRVAASEALRGQKISEYGSASEGNAGAIAVDRHIAMLFFGTKSPNRAQVESAKNRIRAIAERLGWQPREVQAALWAYNQTLLGTAPEDVKSYDKLIEKARARIDALRASIGRGEDRGAREVGGTAGRDGSAERDSAASREQARAEVGPKYSRRADGGSVGKVKTVDVGGFDLPLNPNGTVTLYHHTNEDAAAKIRETGVLRSAGEPTVYVTTEREPTTGYGDAVVAIEVDPRKLSPDDEFPGGRVDFSLDVGRPGGSLRVKIAKDDTRQAPPREGLGASGPRYSQTITIDGTERPTTDSTGKAIHPTEEGVRAFYEWFGDSAVVDDEGRPRVVYHGTNAEFTEFDPWKKRAGWLGKGFYFTEDAEQAARYGSNVMPVYLAGDRVINTLANKISGSGKRAVTIGQAAVGRGTVYVVDKPTQIKSATGNTGAFSPTDARIAYSRKTPAEARAESAQKQADLGAQLVVSPGQSFVYTDKFTDDWRGQTLKMRERIQDKLLSVRNVQQDIEKIRGAIQDAMNVYRRENLMHGRVGDQRDKLQDSHVKPLIEAMAEARVSPALLEDYLEARHAKERNEKIAAIKGGMPDGASGMTTAQADDFLQGRAAGHRSGVTLDPAMTRQVSRLARKVYAITSETRRRLLDSGQITQEAFDALENAYAAYVPLRGKDGTEGGKGRGTGKGIDVRGKPIQRAAGRGEGNRAQNILAEVIADAERSIINAEKLRVGRTLARLVLENPNPDVWAIEPVKTELKVSDGTPEEIYEAVKNLDQEEGTIIVKVKGKPYRIVIEDQRMADALKNMAVETVPEVIQYVAGLNRYFSAVLTRYNPSFVGVNMTRDLLFGMTGIWAEHGTAAAAKAAASYFPAMRAAWRDIQGKPPVNAMGRYAREFAEAGGKTYFGKLENVSDMSQRIGEEFKTFRQMAMPKFLGGEMSPVRALAKVARDSKMVQAIEAVNDTVENTLRLSVYAARREAGASIEQAAEYAKNISVNFNRRGSATSWLNALYLFFNAATQGAHRTLTLLKNPKVQGVLGGLAALQATSAMFLMGLDDEDGEPLWDSISSWDKQRNLILAIPIKREKGWGATVIKIPMPYGFNLFPYMGGRSVELARDLQEKPVSRAIADYTTDAVVGVAQAMSPIPFDDGWKAALPHWVRIFTVLSENKDDLGIPIRAGDQYDSFDKPRSASGRDDTPRPFKIAATALNRLGGGDDYTPPYAKFALDWAPEDLAYLFKTFAGGLGSNVVKSGTLTEKLIAGVPVNFKDVPVLSSFVSNVDQRQATSTRYYDHKDDIEREVARQRDLAKETGEVGDNPMGIKIARNKSGAKVKRGEGYELEGKPGSLFDTYKQAEKDISRIRDEMRAAFNDQSISYSERIRKIDELKAEREEVQRELNAAWREQRKKRTQ